MQIDYGESIEFTVPWDRVRETLDNLTGQAWFHPAFPEWGPTRVNVGRRAGGAGEIRITFHRDAPHGGRPELTGIPESEWSPADRMTTQVPALSGESDVAADPYVRVRFEITKGADSLAYEAEASGPATPERVEAMLRMLLKIDAASA